MKVKIGIIALLIAVCSFLPNNAQAAKTCPYSQKIYIQLNQVSLDADYITVQLTQGTYQVTQLNKDEKGYYVLSTQLMQTKGELSICAQCKCRFQSRAQLMKHMKDKHS